MNIYVYGNCQSTALRKLITEAQPGWTVANTDISAVPVFTDAIVAAHLARAAAADIVIAQPIGAFRDRADLSIDHLRASLPPHVTLMTFPSMFFNGLQSAYDYMVGHFSGHRSDYHNAHSIDMFLTGYNWHDIAAVQLSPEFYNRDLVFSWIDAALADLKRREIDHQTTIRFSPFLEERCWTEVTVNTVNHPRRPALAYMVREIFPDPGSARHGPRRRGGVYPHPGVSASAHCAAPPRSARPRRCWYSPTACVRGPNMCSARCGFAHIMAEPPSVPGMRSPASPPSSRRSARRPFP